MGARAVARVLGELVLPGSCPGCDGPAGSGAAGLCPGCATALAALWPRSAAPTPAPVGLPPCVALGAYEGPLRGAVLAYKDRGRHRLAPILGTQLARGVAACATRLGRPPGTALVVVPVPSSPAAIRERHGDHMDRLARHCVRTLAGFGWPAVLARPATARGKADSAHLDAAARAAAARDAFRLRAGPSRRLARAAAAGACVLAVDDVITTGATLAALTARLAGAGVPVAAAVTLAATRRRAPVPRS